MKTVYYHIPKCGGTTIGQLAYMNFGSSKVLSVYAKDPLDNYDLIRDELDLSKHTFMKSHVPFGSIAAVEGSDCFTILRDPRRRLISLMLDVKRRHSHYLYKSLGGDNFSVNAFMTKAPIWESDNVMVRYLLGLRGFTKKPIEHADYEKATDVLFNHLSCFGIQERFRDTLQLVASKSGMSFVADMKVNAAGARDTIELSGVCRFPDAYKFDQMLYDAALSRFDQQLHGLRSVPVIRARWLQFALRVLAKIR